MKILIKTNLLIISFLFLISGCVRPSSPAIYFSNVSNDYVRNVRGDWNGYYLLKTTELIPNNSKSEIFNVESKSHIFGPVHLEWENASGKKFIKDFIFTKEELASYLKSDWEIERIKKKRHENGGSMLGGNTYFRVQFYFTQDGVEYYTSDNPDIEKIEKEKHDLGVKSLQEFRKRYKK